MLAGGGDGDFPFEDVVAGGLLDVDILPGETAVDGLQGVPVVGGGDHQRVDVRIVEQFAIIIDEFRLVRGFLEDLCATLLADGAVDVADVRDDAIRLGQEALHHRFPPAPHTDAGDPNLGVGRGRGRRQSLRQGGPAHPDRQRVSHELPT